MGNPKHSIYEQKVELNQPVTSLTICTWFYPMKNNERSILFYLKSSSKVNLQRNSDTLEENTGNEDQSTYDNADSNDLNSDSLNSENENNVNQNSENIDSNDPDSETFDDENTGSSSYDDISQAIKLECKLN